MKRNNILALFAGIFAIGALTAPPALADRFGDWDRDESGSISRDEFRAGLSDTGAYDRWDSDGDAALTRQEFHARIGDEPSFPEGSSDDPDAMYDTWDADRDTTLKESEFQDGYYDTYDADGDEELNEQEFSLFEEDREEQGWFN